MNIRVGLRRNATQFCQIILIALIMTAAIAWLWKGEHGPALWPVRIGATVAAVAVGRLVYHLSGSIPEDLPDFLALVPARRFERKGVAFTASLRASDGVSWLSVYFQNRFARPCTATVTLTPELSVLPVVAVPVECPGAAAVVVQGPTRSRPASRVRR